MTGNQKAFLDMIAFSEIGEALLAISDDGYNVLVGATASKPLLFEGYADHPNKLNVALHSTAAGRYQVLHRYFVAYKELLGLPDFSPASQDAIALQQIKECGALGDVAAGDLPAAVSKCARIWASLPGAGYGQHENKFADLQAAFVKAGGILSEGA